MTPLTIDRCTSPLLQRGHVVRAVLLGLLALSLAQISWADDKPGTDVLTFVNGDQLTGTLISEADGKLVFHSNMSGDVSVPVSKVKSLRTDGKYAVIPSHTKLTAGQAAPQIPVGTLAATTDAVSVSGEGGNIRTVPMTDVSFLVQSAEFQKQTGKGPGILKGWTGPITLGATLVDATQTSRSFNGAISLVRAIPTVNWVKPKNKTIFDATASYGLVREPAIAGVQDASSAKTNILHGDLERDQYVTTRFYYLVDASADHNVGSGLQVQQDYGGGAGATIISEKTRTLDVKGDVHYEKQDFYPSEIFPTGQSINLVGATIAENYTEKLPRSLVLSESGLIQPAFNTPANTPSAYTAQVIAALVFPVYKNFGFSVGSQDNFINNPPAGFKKNTFQFTAGITYTLK